MKKHLKFGLITYFLAQLLPLSSASAWASGKPPSSDETRMQRLYQGAVDAAKEAAIRDLKKLPDNNKMPPPPKPSHPHPPKQNRFK